MAKNRVIIERLRPRRSSSRTPRASADASGPQGKLKAGRWRSQEELQSLLAAVEANPDLMHKFMAVYGRGTGGVGKVIREIAEFLTGVDASAGLIEATRITVMLGRKYQPSQGEEE